MGGESSLNVPGIGSLAEIGTGGRLGIIVGARPMGPPVDGEQTYELRIKTLDGRGGTPQTAHIPTNPPAAARKAVQDANTPADPETGRPALPAPRGGRASGVGSLQGKLSAPEQVEVSRLQQRDSQVRQEEKAHAAAAGDLAGPITYVYQIGPDGRPYAVGGSVQVSAQSVSGDADELARLGNRVATAALAAHNPSAADIAAAQAGYQFGADDDSLFRGTQIDISA